MNAPRDRQVATSGLRPFERSLPMALLRAREATMRPFRALLTTHELTEQQWRVLRALTAASAPLEPTGLAEQTFLHAPSLSRILANLDQRGLISRSTVEHDQRRSLISLTEAGRRLVDDIAPHSEAVYRRIEAGYGTERLDRLLRDLDDLAAIDLGPAR